MRKRTFSTILGGLCAALFASGVSAVEKPPVVVNYAFQTVDGIAASGVAQCVIGQLCTVGEPVKHQLFFELTVSAEDCGLHSIRVECPSWNRHCSLRTGISRMEFSHRKPFQSFEIFRGRAEDAGDAVIRSRESAGVLMLSYNMSNSLLKSCHPGRGRL